MSRVRAGQKGEEEVEEERRKPKSNTVETSLCSTTAKRVCGAGAG